MEDLIWDVEANNLTRDVSEIHCVVIIPLDSDAVFRYHDYWSMERSGTLDEGINRIANARMIIGHNIAGYDIDVLERIGKAQFNTDQIVIDTMLLSCILHPNMQMNGLEAWAKKLGYPEQKIQNHDWTVLTQRILDRCVSDVKINKRLYFHLLKEARDLQSRSDILDFGKALELENKVARIHTKQVLHGIYYDVHLAEQLVAEWSVIMKDLTTKIHAQATRRLIRTYQGEVKKVYLKQTKKEEREGADFKYTKAVIDWVNHPDAVRKADGSLLHPLEQHQAPFSRIRFDKVNLDSGPQLKDLMFKLNWVPTTWNRKKDDEGQWINTSPKLTEDSYDSLPEGLGQDVAHYNILKHRLSLLVNKKDPENKGSLPMARLRYDSETQLGNVAADAFTCGTNTVRYRHVKPVANLPGVEAKYGEPSRRIYRGPKGFWQVGIDLSGIEARKLCDLCMPYEGGKEFAELVLEGDWHSENARIWKVPRKIAKIILYAMMYGAGDAKLGGEAGGTAYRGKQIREAFIESNPAYAQLVEDLQRAYQQNGGWIPSCDGRPLYPRSKKDTLNTKIQGDCAIVFKRWMIECDMLDDVQKGYANQMVAYHDELQFAYRKNSGLYTPEKFGERVCDTSLRVGEEMGITVPIAAEYKVGKNYAQCH